MDKDEATRLIRKAAEEGKVAFADTELVEKYEDIVYEFLDKVLGIKKAFVSDESDLSDFTGGSRKYRAEDQVLARANELFGLNLTTARIRLTTIAQQIAHLRAQQEQPN